MSGFISDLEVTYRAALGAHGFHRVVTKESYGADLTKGQGTPVYLWYKTGEGEPVTDITILYDDEAPPDGFTKVAKGLRKGMDEEVFVAYKKGGEERPIMHVSVTYDDTPPGSKEDGWECLERPLNRSGDKVLLWYCRRPEGVEDEVLPSETLMLGDWCDAKDSVNKWCVAQVIEVTDAKIKVHYKGWSSRYDAWMDRKTMRIADLGDHTAGRDTRGSKRQGELVTIEEETFAAFRSKLERYMSGELEGVARDRFVKGEVVNFVEMLLSSSYAEPDLPDKVNDMIVDIIKFIIWHMKRPGPMPLDVTQHLVRIFLGDRDCNYFIINYGATPRNTAKAREIKGFTAQIPASGASKYFVINLNALGDNGGHEEMLRRMVCPDPIISLEELESFTEVLYTCRYCYAPEWAKEMYPKFHEATLNRLTNLTDEELKTVHRDVLGNTLFKLQTLLFQLTDFHGNPVDVTPEELNETYLLRLARRLLVCPYLAQRLKGMQDLADMVERVLRKENKASHRSHSMYPYRQPPVAKWLTSAKLCEWLIENQVVEIALGGKVGGKKLETHVEIIKNLKPIMNFLAAKRSMTPEHLDLLWGAALLPNEQVRRAVFDIISALTQSLPLEQLTSLFAKIRLLPQRDYDADVVLPMIKDFTIHGISQAFRAVRVARAGEGKEAEIDLDDQIYWFGLPVFWGLLQDSATVSAEVEEAAFEAFVDVLRRPQCTIMLQYFLSQAIDSIKSGESVERSLALIKAIAENMPGANQGGGTGGRISVADDWRSSETTRRGMLDSLEVKYNLKGLILDDIRKYKAIVSESKDADGSVGVDDVIFVGKTSHIQSISKRLDFLAFFLTESAEAELSGEEVGALWDMLYTGAASVGESDAFIRWLRVARFGEKWQGYSPTNAAFSEDTTLAVFADYLCSSERFEPHAISEQAYKTFENYFMFVNGRERHIEVPHSPHYFTVSDVALEGVESFWNIALSATDPTVQAAAKARLIALFVRLSPTTPGAEKREVWAGFVELCMKKIAALVESAGKGAGDAAGAPAYGAIGNLMAMLLSFLTEVENAGRSNASGSKVQLNVAEVDRLTNRSIKQIQLNLDASTTFGELRDKVAAKLGHPADRLRLATHSGEFYDVRSKNHRTLKQELRTRYISCVRLDRPESDTAGHVTTTRKEVIDEDRLYPRTILSNSEEHFHLIFSLLGLGSARIVESAWGLLQTLPTNEKVQTQVETFGGVLSADAGAEVAIDWPTLFDGTAPLRLLYNMEIADSILSAAGERTDSEKRSRDTWIEVFLRKGGFDHFFSIVIGLDVTAMMANSLTKRCVALMLKLVSIFMAHAQELRIEPKVDNVALLKKLLNFMQEAGKSAELAASAEEAKGTEADPGVPVATGGGGGPAGGGGGGAGGPAGDNQPGGGGGGGGGDGGDEESKGDAEAADSGVVTDEAAVIRDAMGLLVKAVVAHPELRSALYEFPDVGSVFLYGLLHSPESAVRAEMEKGLCLLCFKVRLSSSPPDLVRSNSGGGTGSVAPMPDVAEAPPVQGGDEVTPRGFFLPLLLKELPRVYDFADYCTEYFRVISKLVRASKSSIEAGDLSIPGVDVNELLASLCTMIKDHPVVELGDADTDLILRGLYTVTVSLLKGRTSLKRKAGAVEGHGLLEEVFENGLFAMPQADSRGAAGPPKAKSDATRKLAFTLLAELCRGCHENNAETCSRVLPHHAGGDDDSGARAVSASPRSSTGYVGLNNLGCICYMNASNQQFFMHPKFRQGCLLFDDEEDDKTESFMYQLQLMYAHLQESERQAYNPKPYCHAFKDWEGNPTNTAVQKDASEYLTMMFQHMENQISGTKSDKLLKSCFGGEIANELIADGKYSTRAESFYFVSVPVQHKKNLYEGLAEYISGETVSYKWEEEGGEKRELDTTRRSSFKTLPSSLIIHLKRFEFDYTTMQQAKLNDRYEFPSLLDMKPYTLEGRPDQAEGAERDVDPDTSHPPEYYQYELMGVVIHTGTAHSGHYYSFIRERDGVRNWFRFDDSHVTPWNPALIDSECFGGDRYGGRYSYGGNALLLFYDRVQPKLKLIREPSEPEADVDASAILGRGVLAGVFAAKMLKRHRSRQAQIKSRGVVPKAIFRAIWDENMAYWRQRTIYNRQYFDFMWQLLEGAASTVSDADKVGYPVDGIRNDAHARELGGPTMDVIKVLTFFVLGTLTRSKDDAAHFAQWIEKIKALYASNLVACVWLLQTFMADQKKLLTLLLKSDQTTRAAVAGLLGYVLKAADASKHERIPDPSEVSPVPAHGRTTREVGGDEEKKGGGDAGDEEKKGGEAVEDTKEEGKVPDFPAPAGMVCVTFIETLLSQIPGIHRYWRTFSEFFRVLSEYADLGPEERRYLLKRGTIGIVTDLILGKESPHPELNEVVEVSRLELKRALSVGSESDMAIVPYGPHLPSTADGMHVQGVGLNTVSRASREMGDRNSQPNFQWHMTLLKNLVIASLPPTKVPSPHQLEPALELSEIDEEMISSKPFLRRVMAQFRSTRLMNGYLPMCEHLCNDNPAFSELFVKALNEGIAQADWTELRPFFRAVRFLVSIEDDNAAERVNTVLSSLVVTLKSQAQYFKATEHGIILFSRLGKREVVAKWVREHREAVEWMTAWLEKNREPPYSSFHHNPHAMKLHKPGSSGGNRNEADNYRSPKIQENLNRLMDGKDLLLSGYDSDDDPSSLIAKRIEVQWSGNKWYKGTVVKYSPESRSHTIIYDDNDRRVYDLTLKAFEVLADQTLPTPVDPRVASDLAACGMIVPGFNDGPAPEPAAEAAGGDGGGGGGGGAEA